MDIQRVWATIARAAVTDVPYGMIRPRVLFCLVMFE